AFVADHDPFIFVGINGLSARSLVAAEKHHPVERADQDVELAPVLPIDHRHPTAERFDVVFLIRDFEDRLAGLVSDNFPDVELTFAQTAEEIELPRIVGAGDQVEDAVAVEIHELWTGADASVNRHFGINAAGLEVDRLGIAWLLVGAFVAVEAEQATEV